MTRNAGKSFLLNGATATTWSAVGTLVGQFVVSKDPVLCRRNTTNFPTYWLTPPYQLWLGRLDFIDRPFLGFSLCLDANVFCGLWAKQETFHVTYPGYVLDVSLVKGSRVFSDRLLRSWGWRGWVIQELLISLFSPTRCTAGDGCNVGKRLRWRHARELVRGCSRLLFV